LIPLLGPKYPRWRALIPSRDSHILPLRQSPDSVRIIFGGSADPLIPNPFEPPCLGSFSSSLRLSLWKCVYCHQFLGAVTLAIPLSLISIISLYQSMPTGIRLRQCRLHLLKCFVCCCLDFFVLMLPLQLIGACHITPALPVKATHRKLAPVHPWILTNFC
jgi:hypothetical protein